MVVEKIKAILDEQKMEYSSLSKDSPFRNSLLVFLEIDQKKRERILEISVDTEPLQPHSMMPQEGDLPYSIRFVVKLPFKIEGIALNQVASLLHFINQSIALPGFELNELEGVVAYRYVWIIDDSSLHKMTIMTIISSIMINLAFFSETIESLSDGKLSFNDLLLKITNINNKQ